ERGVRQTPQRETVRLLAEALELAAPERATLEAAAHRRALPGAPGAGEQAALARRTAGDQPPPPVRVAAPADLPLGTVTFLFTDIEGSTRRWEQHPQAMRAAVARHEALLRAAITAQSGVVFRTVGDGLCAAF